MVYCVPGSSKLWPEDMKTTPSCHPQSTGLVRGKCPQVTTQQRTLNATGKKQKELRQDTSDRGRKVSQESCKNKQVFRNCCEV